MNFLIKTQKSNKSNLLNRISLKLNILLLVKRYRKKHHRLLYKITQKDTDQRGFEKYKQISLKLNLLIISISMNLNPIKPM